MSRFDSKFDSNPFEEDGSGNPYSGSGASSGTATGTASFFDNVSGGGGGAVRPLPPESRSGSTFDPTSDLQFSPRSLKRKQKELQDKEAALKRKEKELSSREQTLGLQKPNWPPCWPLVRHDIAADIPDYLQGMQRNAFYSWLGCVTALSYNFVIVTVAWIMGATSATAGLGNFFLALIYVCLGVPLSFFLWYRRLYNSLKNDSSFGLVLFFISYTSHIVWFIFASIAPPIFYFGASLCGVLTTIDMLGDNGVVGILYAVGCALFICEVLLSIWVIGQVYSYFRGAGKANEMKREAALSTLRNTV